MAITFEIGQECPKNLFCESKFWGSPDMPEDMEYPMHGDSPLMFLCQVATYDLAALAPQGMFPEDGMLYFFADGEMLFGEGGTVAGEWPKGSALVKFTKAVNMETFQSIILLGEDDEPIAQKALPVTFAACADDFGGMRMLGDAPEGYICLLQIPLDPRHTVRFQIKESDFGYGNWKKATLTVIEKN